VILAFSGTSNARLAIYDIKANQVRYQTSFSHPQKESWRVHDGFQMVFQGVRTSARRALREAIESLHRVTEVRNGEWDLVLTAHSLGTAISYLFLLDVLHEGISPNGELRQECDPLPSIPPSCNITIASFGPPRLANPALVEHFHELAKEFRERRGREEAFTEWTVIGHNDGKFLLYAAFIQAEPLRPGVPALPPASFGFAHIASNPFYLYQGTLYKVPMSEKEHGHFHIDMATTPSAGAESTPRPLHPKGGHNYYAGRDMERLQKRLKSIAKDVAATVSRPGEAEQPCGRDSEPGTADQRESRSSDCTQRRRHSSNGPSRASYNDLKSPFSRELPRATSVGRHPGDSIISGSRIASFTAGMFRRQTRNQAGLVTTDGNPIKNADSASMELGQDARPGTTSPASLLVEESCSVPLQGPTGTDPPWVALYLARERAEDQLWEDKLKKSVWSTLRGVVGFVAAGNGKVKVEQSSHGSMENTRNSSPTR